MATKRKNILRKVLIGLGIITAAELIFVLITLSQGRTIALFQPAGTIAAQQRDLMVFTAILSLFVIIPVFVLLGFILWRFRDGNVKAKYRPNWDGSKKLETIWWGIPLIIITILAVVTFKTSHSLDPFKELSSSKEPMTIQVVALEWKWLFIYPNDDIATVNYVQIPVDTPIKFKITSDAAMNSFWIPQLGGQIYAMAGMETQLHLMADKAGTYDGSSANISGEGFSGMKFKVVASSEAEWESWHMKAHKSPDVLTKDTYAKLAKPTKNEPVSLYSSVDDNLFSGIIMKYMDTHSSTDNSQTHEEATADHHTGGHN